jgi:hypothetical protein
MRRDVGYESGPDATVRATETGWRRVGAARAVVVVEGVSDQIALDAAAEVLGVDLAAQGVVVLPIGGAQAITRTLAELAARRDDVVVAGMCDAGEEHVFQRAVGAATGSEIDDRAGLERAGYFVCVADLEDELIRAAGADLVERVMAQEGDDASFTIMRSQLAWRGAPIESQARRFIGAGARRKQSYARALVHAVGPSAVPHPLVGVIAHVTSA